MISFLLVFLKDRACYKLAAFQSSNQVLHKNRKIL